VIYNNQVWNASLECRPRLVPGRRSGPDAKLSGHGFNPLTELRAHAQACGAYAARVEEPSEVPDALAKALKVVKEEGRQALLNVICKNPLA